LPICSRLKIEANQQNKTILLSLRGKCFKGIVALLKKRRRSRHCNEMALLPDLLFELLKGRGDGQKRGGEAGQMGGKGGSGPFSKTRDRRLKNLSFWDNGKRRQLSKPEESATVASRRRKKP